MININKKTTLILFAVLFCVSLALNVWQAYQFSVVSRAYIGQDMNGRVLSFTKMFVHDILMANTEIGFDTRLALETSVRSLADQQIFDQWQKFVKATAKEDASSQAKILLDLLLKKIAQ